MRSQFLLAAVVTSLAASAFALNATAWRAQSIYQVMTDRFAKSDGTTGGTCDLNTYCGGTWQGLIRQLDYIQDMGFTAVWISPVVENIVDSTLDGEAYHGYWARDPSNLNPRFGTVQDLKDLSTALHARGMYLMVDIVTNHLAQASSRANFDYSKLGDGFNEQEYFHPPCSIDYNDETSRLDCWPGDDIVALADLKTGLSEVQGRLDLWVKELVADYSIDGLRIDSAISVDMASLHSTQVAAGDIHVLGEVFQADPAFICPYLDHISGVLNYPMYFAITAAFRSTNGDVQALATQITKVKSTCKDTAVLGAFLENHDNPRFPSLTSDQALIKNAIAFALLQDGIPILYQGQEQSLFGGAIPNNREAVWTQGYSTTSPMYLSIKTINAFRTWAINQDPHGFLAYQSFPLQADSSVIVTRKGVPGRQMIGVYSNLGAGSADRTVEIAGGSSTESSQFSAGQSVTDVFSCQVFTADQDGNLAVTIKGGLPLVLFPTDALAGSGICSP